MSLHLVVHTDWDQHPLSPEDIKILRKMDVEVHPLNPRTNPAFLEIAGRADAVLNADFPITAELLSALRKCRVVSRYGSGVDNIDVQAATRLGIPVANVPDFCAEAVATRALLLALNDYVRNGRWGLKGLPFALELRGKILGLVGFGKIARAVCMQAKGFGLEVMACDPYVDDRVMKTYEVRPCDLDTLLRTSDLVSLHLPLAKETRHILSEGRLGLMKRSSILINTARGALVDQQALVKALQQHRLYGAGLDVFEAEPPDTHHPLFALKNVVTTPHCAAHTLEATARVRRAALEAIVAVFTSGRPKHMVNAEI
jgi:D-3-phosphoglycerate dehydrogenase / 2-oxoglutarate reductase